MFSRLDAIFKNNFLPLKEGDTYPSEKNDDEKAPRKRTAEKNKKRKHESSDFGDDLTIVSVATLLAFLNELTHAPDIKHDFSGKNKPPHNTQNQRKQPQDAKSRQAERASNAYRHTAAAGNPPQPAKIEARIDRMLFHLDEEEKQFLSGLIADLESLQKQGTRQLEIPNSRNFFRGIIDAVATAREP